MPVAILKQAGAIWNQPNTRDRTKSQLRCQPLYFILDNPERGSMFKIPELSFRFIDWGLFIQVLVRVKGPIGPWLKEFDKGYSKSWSVCVFV